MKPIAKIAGFLLSSLLVQSVNIVYAIESSSSGAKGSQGLQTSIVPNTGTGQMWIFTDSPPVTNGAPSYTVNGVATPWALGPAITTGWIFTYTYGPPTLTSDILAKQVPTNAVLESTSTGVWPAWTLLTGRAPTAKAKATQEVSLDGKKVTLGVDTDVDGRKDAFARSRDPLEFPAGSVDFINTFENIELWAEGDGAYSGVNYWMGSSIENYEEIYRLEIHLESPSSSVPFIDFTPNPLVTFNKTEAEIESELLASLPLDISTGRRTQTMPLELTFTLDSTEDFAVDFYSDAYAHANPSVPEPNSTLALLTLGTIGVTFTIRRKLKQ